MLNPLRCTSHSIRMRAPRRPTSLCAALLATVAVIGSVSMGGPVPAYAGKSNADPVDSRLASCRLDAYEYRLRGLSCADAHLLASNVQVGGQTVLIVATRTGGNRELRGSWYCSLHPPTGWMRCRQHARGFTRIPLH
jgi:hypothetical protein